MKKLLAIGEAAQAFGVSITTLRRWEVEGLLVPERTAGNQRRYDMAKLRPELFYAAPPEGLKTIAYARVSGTDQKDELDSQKRMLESYCAKQGWTYEVVTDLGSGMNYKKKGLHRLLNQIVEGHVGRLVIANKDRLLRLGAELVFAVCEAKGVEVLIINQDVNSSFEDDLAMDVLEIATVFSARLYGGRSLKNQQLLDGVKGVVEAVTRHTKNRLPS